MAPHRPCEAWLPTCWSHSLRQERKKGTEPAALLASETWALTNRASTSTWSSKWTCRGRNLGNGLGDAPPHQWSHISSPRQETNFPFSPALQYPPPYPPDLARAHPHSDPHSYRALRVSIRKGGKRFLCLELLCSGRLLAFQRV